MYKLKNNASNPIKIKKYPIIIILLRLCLESLNPKKSNITHPIVPRRLSNKDGAILFFTSL